MSPEKKLYKGEKKIFEGLDIKKTYRCAVNGAYGRADSFSLKPCWAKQQNK